MFLVILFAYFIGSVPFALLLARRWHVADLRRVGSGNLGAANVMRASGVTAGILVALLDMTKGAASVWLAERFTTSAVAPAAAGVAAIVGHIYPVWLRLPRGQGRCDGVRRLLAADAVGGAAGARHFHRRRLADEVHLAGIGPRVIGTAAARLSHRQSSGGGRRRQRGGDAHHLPSSIQYDPAPRPHRAASGCARVKKIAVLGAGSWGTALSVHLGRLDHDVCLWARDGALVDEMRASRVNDVYLPGVVLPETVSITPDVAAAVAGRNLMVWRSRPTGAGS